MTKNNHFLYVFVQRKKKKEIKCKVFNNFCLHEENFKQIFMNQLKENFCLHKFSKMVPRLTKLTKLSDCNFWPKLSGLYPADCPMDFSKEKM